LDRADRERQPATERMYWESDPWHEVYDRDPGLRVLYDV
jgi:hypothetical protein